MPNHNNKQLFKSWVPYWLILVGIFITLIPIALALGVYMGGMSSAASYYGVDTTDIRFSVVIYYLAIAAAFPLEARFYNFFSSKPYFIACCLFYVLINLALYNTHSFAMLLVLRFVGGMSSLGIIGTMFSLVFRQFHEQRSRVLGYATMYAALFSSAPLAQLIDAWVFSNYNFNVLFLVEIFSAIPGIILMFCILKDGVDLTRNGKIPLKLVRWESFVLYSSALLLAAYILLYGQYYHWFRSARIVSCTIVLGVLLCLFLVRQIKLEKPYIDLRVYKSRNFRIGMLLLVLFYLSKGDTGLLYGFYANSVKLDPYWLGYVNLINAAGIISGSLLAARFVLARRKIRLIWMTGFGALLAFHIYILLILGSQAGTADLIIPLFLQGFGNGVLILSIVIFYVTAVPPEISFSASVSGVAYRALTFTGSMALTSYMSLYFQKIHYQYFALGIRADSPLLMERIGQYRQSLQDGGAAAAQLSAGSSQMLGKAVAVQDNLLVVRDYYSYMSAFILLVILGIALIPHFQYQLRKIGSRLIPV
ncbi:MFS transporter [Mangrovibacterium marinum]|uniref:MFS transporter n=1 Tax=Mangrovibacterium marinum TaxID=1639118 RepID=UPI002A18E369|nr:MFS transporter [Mangrovibacterium marinum]